MKTLLYLIRPGATEANLARPPRLQGCRHDSPLARAGIRQAEATRDFLAHQPLHHCYSSPLLRAMQTATIVAASYGLAPQPVEALTDCDVGRWGGLDWQTVRYLDAEAYQRFLSNPAEHGYPGGESLGDVERRIQPFFEEVLQAHAGQSILVVTHHVVHRTYVAGLLGLTPDQSRQIAMHNCGISVVVREGERTAVSTLNGTFHLQNMAA